MGAVVSVVIKDEVAGDVVVVVKGAVLVVSEIEEIEDVVFTEVVDGVEVLMEETWEDVAEVVG